MRLISFKCDNEEHLVNPEKIKWMRARASGDTLITFDDDSEMVVEHCLREVGARINNQELNVAYDCTRSSDSSIASNNYHAPPHQQNYDIHTTRIINRLANSTGLKVWTLTKGEHFWRIETKDMLTARIQGKTKAELLNRCEAFLDGVVLTARLNSKN